MLLFLRVVPNRLEDQSGVRIPCGSYGFTETGVPLHAKALMLINQGCSLQNGSFFASLIPLSLALSHLPVSLDNFPISFLASSKIGKQEFQLCSNFYHLKFFGVCKPFYYPIFVISYVSMLLLSLKLLVDLWAAPEDAKSSVGSTEPVGYFWFAKSVIKLLAFNEDNFCFILCAITSRNFSPPKLLSVILNFPATQK